MEKRKKFDPKAPEAGKMRDEIVHGTFMTEGTMVAFPLCFPGASAPIAADESHITALDRTPDGMVYGGTSGKQAHLFVAMLHGVTGAVFDMGAVEGADACVAICCGHGKFVACVNGNQGSCFVRQDLQGLPFDLLQEWGFARRPFEFLESPFPDEPFVHAVTDRARQKVIAATEAHLVVLDIQSGETEVAGKIPRTSRLAVGPNGTIFGADTEDTLWLYRISAGLKRHAVELPEGSWDATALCWAREPNEGRLYLADAEGQLFAFTEEDGFSVCLGRAPLTPVGLMAVTFDGRLFGFCGKGIRRLFGYNPATYAITDIGVAVSVFQRRRYGYLFGDAVVGRDGQILFGEDDDLGHLWIYFPRIPRG